MVREYAIDLLRDSVGSDAAVEPATVPGGTKAPPLNPFALGIPVLLIGVVLTFIFPPVGMGMLLLGTVICAVGLAMAVFRSTRQRWRSRRDVQ